MPTAEPFPLIFARSPNAQYYDYALGAAWQAGATWIPNPDYALFKDPAIYEKATRDPIIGLSIEQRLHDVAGRPILVQPRSADPADIAKAQIHEKLLDELGFFSMSAYQLAKAVFQAASYAFIEGERRWMNLAGVREEWWVPTKLRDIGWRRVRYATDLVAGQDGKRTRQTWMELFSLDNLQFVRLKDTRRLVRFVYDDSESGLNYGLGMMACLYHYFWMKEQVLAYGLQWLERWALGLVVAKIDASAGSDIDLSNPKVRTAYLNVLKSMASRHQIAIDSRDDIEVKQNSGDGYQAALKFCEYFDSAMVRRITGSRMPTGGGGPGGLGAGEQAAVEERTADTQVNYDRNLLFENLTQCLGGWIEHVNAPQFAAAGLADAKAPRYKPQPHEGDDPDAAADVLVKMSQMGTPIPVKREEFYENLGYSQPDEDDDVLMIGGQQAQGPTDGGPGGIPDLTMLQDMPSLDDLRDGPGAEEFFRRRAARGRRRAARGRRRPARV